MPAVLTSAQLARDLAITDLSDPAEGPPHAIQLLAGLAVSAVTSVWGRAARSCRGSRVVTIADNYDRLGYPASAVTREAAHTRYVDDTRVLRSHSTAMVLPALRQLAEDPPDDVLLVCPGIVYRGEAIDWQHSPAPHQRDLWRISRKPLGEAAMHEMITVLLGALAPGRESMEQRRDHPYTTAGRQVDVAHAGGWVEVWECGLADPRVLAEAARPHRSGLALGMGLDRLLMLRKGIPDIRLLRSADARVASQMLDLAPYRPVSAMPAVRRDLSVAVDAETDDEILGGPGGHRRRAQTVGSKHVGHRRYRASRRPVVPDGHAQGGPGVAWLAAGAPGRAHPGAGRRRAGRGGPGRRPVPAGAAVGRRGR